MKIVLSAVALYLLFLQTPERIPRLLSESEDVVSREVREARATPVWDSPARSPFEPLDAPPRPLQAGDLPPVSARHTAVDLIPDLPELPIETSDVVVVGEIINVQPFLTKSHTLLYSEYTVRVLESIKPKAQDKGSLVILGMGGKARLEDGRVIEHQVTGLGDPLLEGRQYLLFLSFNPKLDAYGVQSMWHVEGGVITAAFPMHKAKAGRFQSNQGKPLADVLSFLRSKLEQ